MNTDLSGKRAMIGGSTQGIGKAAAFALAGLGADITLIARNEESLKEVLNELGSKYPGDHDYICADYGDLKKLESKLKEYLSSGRTINILVNNTGGPPGGPAHKAKPEEYVDAFSKHLLCNQIITSAILEGMIKSKYGRIINIISTSVKQPLNGLGVSNTVRGAVANWAKTLANELGVHGITVNNVLPGATSTQRLSSIIENKASKSGQNKNEVADKMLSQIPLNRFAEPEELGNAIAFLASPAAAYISGINLPVDGGRTGCL